MPTDTLPPARDLRLDFFRGVAMCLILIAHITDNPWTLLVPARFGFSDSTEIFVFCSGMASALAFGRLYLRAGWGMGSLRVGLRMWQIYWVHVGVFLATFAALQALDLSGLFARGEVEALNLHMFVQDAGPNLLGLLTLTYVPNYFDILPMYLGILALLPLFMAIAHLHPALAMLASAALWLWATLSGFNLPAELWFTEQTGRVWFFNPFAWQVLFFAGFALMAGWLPRPRLHAGLIWLALAVVLGSVPFAWARVIDHVPFLQAWRADWLVLHDKSGLGLLRLVHFLALAYLGWALVGPGGIWLRQGAVRARLTGLLVTIGQQSLAVFAGSMVLARILGAVLQEAGRGPLATAIVNIGGLVLIYALAKGVAFFKRQPWKGAAPQRPRPTSFSAPIGRQVQI